MFKSFLQLVYPRLCGACQFPLLAAEDFICTGCRFDLPKPGLFLPTPNWITAKFDGLFDFKDANTFFLFSEGSRVQHLMHQVKYKGQSALGDFLGEVFVAVIWEQLLNFIGACIRFLFVRKTFAELLKDYESNPFIGLLLVLFVFFLIVFIK